MVKSVQRLINDSPIATQRSTQFEERIACIETLRKKYTVSRRRISNEIIFLGLRNRDGQKAPIKLIFLCIERDCEVSYAFQVSGHPKCVKYDQFHAGNLFYEGYDVKARQLMPCRRKNETKRKNAFQSKYNA